MSEGTAMWRCGMRHAVAKLDRRIKELKAQRSSKAREEQITLLKAIADDLWEISKRSPETYDAAFAIERADMWEAPAIRAPERGHLAHDARKART